MTRMARMGRSNPLMVGLDVGTYKVGVIVAELSYKGAEIVGIGADNGEGRCVKRWRRI